MTGLILILGLVAAAPPGPTVDVTGTCPSADAVAVALGSALGTEPKPGETNANGKNAPKVTDLGDRFSVSALGQAREYADPARDCDERARAAAVFIALALNPPIVPAPPLPPAPPVPVQTAARPPLAPPPSARSLEVGAAARVDSATQPETSFAIGFEVRAAVGWRWLGVTAMAGVLAPTDSRFSAVTVRQQRFPLSLALTARHRLGERLAVAGAVGGALVPFTLRAGGIDGAPSSTRLDAGVRLALELAVLATPRLAPFIGVHAEIFPRAYELDVGPPSNVGNVGSTGRFWLGASVGLSFAP
jgi:hypothetical protein